jgi:hypothetical protein
MNHWMLGWMGGGIFKRMWQLCSVVYLFIFETEDGLELVILLPQLAECWDYRFAQPCLAI